MTRFDVAIVGAGPAGCWAAYKLARQGARVALVDGSHPREKPCGGGVTSRALDLVREALPAERMGVAIESATFAACGRSASIPLSGQPTRPELVIFARRDFDGALLQAAATAGATIVHSRAAGIERQNGDWSISTSDGGVRCKWLVGADGANSFVRRRVFRPFRRADLSIASGYFVHGASSREVTVVFEAEPPGYLWSFPRADHLAVGVGAQANESSSTALFALAAAWISENVNDRSVRIERYSWPIPSLDADALERERAAGDNWMLIGDAAGLVDPITREGIFFALASGEAAAASLMEADPARGYEQRVRDDMHDELRRAARMKRRFFRAPFMPLLIRALQCSAPVQAIMTDLVAGQQPYRSLRRRLLKTFELRLMFELFFSRV
jgi:geranylgeranyl reductase family protein